MAGRIIDQTRKGQRRSISIRIANKEFFSIQMWIKSTHWLFLKRDRIPTKHLINRKRDIGIFCLYMLLLSERWRPEKVNKIQINSECLQFMSIICINYCIWNIKSKRRAIFFNRMTYFRTFGALCGKLIESFLFFHATKRIAIVI